MKNQTDVKELVEQVLREQEQEQAQTETMLRYYKPIRNDR